MSAIEQSGPYAALAPRQRYLPRTEAAGFVIGDSEPVAVALQRITTDQFTQAIAALSDHRTEIGAAAHAASQNLTRIAAVVRLARGAIGEKAYRIELAVLRDTTDLLSGLVAGEIEIQAIDHLRARYEPLLRPLVFSDLREQLLDRHQLLRLELLPAVRDGGELSLAVQQLRRACARFAAWPVDQPMYGRAPVPDSFSAFAEGLERAYRACREHWMAAVSGDRADPTRWMRATRILGHQIEVLGSAWPDLIAATAASSERLLATLADQKAVAALHDVAALHTAVAEPATLILDRVEQDLLEAICEHERQELSGVAAVLGARLYAEKPAPFVARIERYWDTRA